MKENKQHTAEAAPAGEELVFGTGPGTIEPVADPRYAHLAPQDIAQPFVVLDESGIFSRTLLGRVRMCDGQATFVALRIQKDVPAVPAARGFGRSYTNLDAVAEFDREAECRRNIPPDQTGMVSTVGESAAARLPLVSLPLTYCKKIRQFFHPVCPECGEFLRDCRDEGFLARSGLPGYAATARRVLYCAVCATKSGAAPTVYSPVGFSQAAGASARVRVGTELYRDFGRLLALGAGDASGKDQEKPGLRQFICPGCPHRAACYPARLDETRAILAEKLLYPLAYFEFCAIPRELYELHYDEFAPLLGGRSAEEVMAAVLRRIPRELGRERATPIENSHPGSPAYFHTVSGSLSAAEILWLKLGAFEQLCAGLLNVYERCRRPHLNVQPKSIMVSLGEPARGRPVCWSFRVGLLNPASAVPVRIDDHSAGSGPVDFLSQPYFNRLYTSPLVRRQPFGREEYANLTIRGIAHEKDGLDITGDLVSDVLSALGLAERDQVKITLSAPGGPLDGFAFWAEVAEAISGGYRIFSRAERLQAGIAETLERVVGQTLWDCRANICRRYDLRCDLYSLGMMLFCSLLVNDEQDETRVCLAVEDIGRRLESFARSRAGVTPRQVDGELRRLLPEHGNLFAPAAVLYCAADRKFGADDLSPQIWFACQKLGWQMATEISGFSMIACGRGVTPEEAPAALKSVMERSKDLNLWVEGRLFARRALRRELGLTCQV